VKLHWLVPGTFVILFMLLLPAHAARLQSWRFDARQNQLEINTEGAVQPQAQLIFNPTRLVIDLPGTLFGHPQYTQSVSGAISAIRIGQFDEQTSRIVVELAPGYTLDPKRVKFVGKTPNRWIVQLPKPENIATQEVYSDARNVSGGVTIHSNNQLDNLQAFNTNIRPGKTRIENIHVTGDGLFVSTSGGNPQTRIIRSRDRTSIFLDISDASLSPRLLQQDVPINRYGVYRIQFTQLQTKRPVVRMTMVVEQDSPDWQLITSSPDGLVLLPYRQGGNLPKGSISRNQNDNDSRAFSSVDSPNEISFTAKHESGISSTPHFQDSVPRSDSLSTIKSVEISSDNTQLLIRGNRNLFASGGWDRSTGLYRITIPNARLAPAVKGPNLNANSPIFRVRLQQQDPHTVIIFVQPAAGVQIRLRNQSNDESVALELRRTPWFAPPLGLPQVQRRGLVGGLPPLPQSNPQPMSGANIDNPVLPQPSRTPHGTVVVMIDPGHGGHDSGAVGIGGVQEKDIVLPIGRKLAEVLQHNGLQVILTRNADYFVSLQGRVDMAERDHADVFVSVHANSIDNRPDVNGLEVYYYDSGLDLARVVRHSILQRVNVNDRGIRRARFYVLRKSSMPAILVETGYMTGREDIAKLKTVQYQNKMAEAIAHGILQYLRGR
jgi:N-acetylmuramoyl-L-alanine amidase